MKLHHQLMIRVPQFSYHATLDDIWEELLQSIEYASPEFYEKIAYLTPQTLQAQPPKIIQTVLKYFNRAKYRCTPLGTFSSFGIAGISKTAESQIVIKPIRTIHIFPDWKYSKHVDYVFEDVWSNNLKLIANSTYYQIENAIRYVRRKPDTESFELAEVQATSTILALLKAMRAAVPIKEIIRLFEEQLEQDFLLNLLEAMILANLIITEFDPNTTGLEYFTRIGKYNFEEPKPYIISELNFKANNLSEKHVKHIPALIQHLTQLLPQKTNSIHLTEFITQYTDLFDRRHIRVMEALDPQIGVGYGNLHKEQTGETIIDKLLSDLNEPHATGNEDNIQDFLKTNLSFSIGETIDLATIAEPHLPNEVENKLPNTFSVIGSVVNDNFYLERIGGHTANQLAGRFSLCGDQAFQYSNDMATIEQDANPEVVFFDIAYHAELAVDNINRRPQLYEQELNLICYPGIDDPITLEDLYISISGNSIVLRSQRLGKRVVPRMSSAYNYRRSQLPIFRFLYDLAFYNVWPELSFDITQFLPGLKYYPKVVFKNIVLSLPKLIFLKKDYQQLAQEDIEVLIIRLLQQYQFGHHIKVLKGEEHTVYNLDNKQEMRLFMTEILRQERTTIEELILPAHALVEDQNGNAYLNQIIIPVYHNKEIYHGSAPIIPNSEMVERDFLPLQEWIFYDLFLHPLHMDRLLLDIIDHFILYNTKEIKEWFFIRYNVQGDHLRLRMKANSDCQAELIKCLNQIVKPYTHSGILKEVKINTYKREMERYDVAGITNVETLFHKSSLLVYELLKNNLPDLEKYEHCLRIFLGVHKSLVIGQKRFIDWTSFIRNTLEKEHHLKNTAFKALNQFIKINNTNYKSEGTEMEQLYMDSIIELLQHCPQRRQAPLFTDFMHMHINRLFAENQRTHEMICYNMLKVLLQRETKSF
ncbi:thiopeptide-type bacteriocin biosynthesis protein [Sphingobacterium faecium]|uniref:lantibiotic dehydratase n=1 Tax=Sphingobacterium faecium TaxID=34087 RepID=UPI003208B84B